MKEIYRDFVKTAEAVSEKVVNLNFFTARPAAAKPD